MTKAIIELAHSLNKTVVAEGVESRLTAESLTDIGCDYNQGYYFSQPLPAFECIVQCEQVIALRSTESSRLRAVVI